MYCKKFIRKKEKKAVSLMISYVILITIAIAMAITVFAWLKLVANVEPLPSCGDGTSIIINDYVCGGGILNLTIKNNGRFSVDGFTIQVGDNPQRQPITHILPWNNTELSVEGYFRFDSPLKPGETRSALFSDSKKGGDPLGFSDIVNLKIQPYTFYESKEVKKTKILCQQAVLKQNLGSCNIESIMSLGGGLLAHWTFDDLVDSVNGLTGTLQGGALIDRGVLRLMDGQFFAVPNDVNLERKNQMTFSAWVSFLNLSSEIGKDQFIFIKGEEYLLRSDLGNNKFNFFVYDTDNSVTTGGGGFWEHRVVSTTDVVRNKWFHVAATLDYDGLNIVKKIYIDGSLRGTETSQISASLDATSNPLHIGSFLNGSIDDVRIWDRILTEEEIRGVMNQIRNTDPYVDLVEGTSSATADAIQGGTIEIRCDFGTPTLPCLTASHEDGVGSCTWVGWDVTNNNVGIFNCIADTVGSIENYCGTWDYPWGGCYGGNRVWVSNTAVTAAP
jgi:hypothetical protein